MPNKCPPLWRSCGFSHPRWYFLQIFRISNHQIPSVLIVRFFHLHCSRYNCTCCFCFCTPYKYMGRYCPKEWKNRGKVTKKLRRRHKMIILVVKILWLLFFWDNPLRKARERAVEIWTSSSHAYMRAPSNSDVDFLLSQVSHERWKLNPNRSLDRYSAICYREYNFLPSFILLLASCFLLDFILRFLAMA